MKLAPLFALTAALAAASPHTGPAPGSPIPGFRLEDQSGTLRDFRSLRGPRGLMLVFTRSADWCPFCKAQLVELEEKRAMLERKGLRIAVITYDPRPALAHFAARRKIGYPLLSDPGSHVIRSFGILNDTVPPGTPGFGVPYPVTYIVDAKGIVKSKYFESDARQIYSAGSIALREFNEAEGGGTVARSPRLTVTARATGGSLAMGRRVTLIADLELPARMHVYAPGVRGYKPLEWNISPAPAFTVEPARFPDPRMLHLPAIGETVPVYEKRLRLTRDIVAAVGKDARAIASGGNLEIAGELRFQACDDTQCYLPETVPLVWTFRLEKPDSERVPPELRGGLK